MTPRARHPAAGFTLVELLVAATVTVLIATSATMVLRGVTEADKRVDSRARLALEGRAAMQTIVEALRNAQRPIVGENIQWPVFEGLDESMDALPRDRFRFFTVSDRPVRAGQPESDLREIEFGIVDPGDGSLPVLVRRLDPTRNDGEDETPGGGVVERIADGVLAFNVTYHNGVEYLDDWPLNTGFPAAVKIELVLALTPPPTAAAASGGAVRVPTESMPLVLSRVVALDHGYYTNAEGLSTPARNTLTAPTPNAATGPSGGATTGSSPRGAE